MQSFNFSVVHLIAIVDKKISLREDNEIKHTDVSRVKMNRNMDMSLTCFLFLKRLRHFNSFN